MAGIFKKNDIRGIYGENLTDEIVYQIAVALGQRFGERTEFAIAGDSRLSTPKVKELFCKGLNSVGCKTYDMDLGPTPMTYFAANYFTNIGIGVMITASHNPKSDNGIKVCDHTGAAFHYDNLYKFLEEDVKNSNETIPSSKINTTLYIDGKQMAEKYYEYISSKFHFSTKLNVIAEYGNGAAGNFSNLIHKLGCKVTSIRQKPDGNFPTLLPDPTKDHTYNELKEKLVSRKEEFDIGIAFDGDGDRVGFILPNGEIISPDQVAMLYGKELLEKNPHGKLLIDVKISKATSDYFEEIGGEIILTKVGHSWVHENLVSKNADIAAELSGHYYFQDEYLGFDDGLYAALRFLRIVDQIKKTNQTITGMINSLPKYYPSQEFRDHIPENIQNKILENLSEFVRTNNGLIISIDGIRGEFENSWFIARKSGTEEALSYRVEGVSAQDRDVLLNKIMKIIKQT